MLPSSVGKRSPEQNAKRLIIRRSNERQWVLSANHSINIQWNPEVQRLKQRLY